MTRLGYALVTALAAELFAGLFVTVAIVAPRPRLIWNASASAPLGLYALHDVGAPAVGDLVAAMPPERLAAWMTERRYLPRGVPLLKHVAARGGQRVCRNGDSIRVDGRVVATALNRDSQGRALPVWQGCRTLGRGDILLLNAAVRDSLDGRYFGALPASTLLGRATPILTSDAPDAPLRWRGLRGTRQLHTPAKRRSAMPMNILDPTDNGYAGRIRLFGIDEAIVLVALDPSDTENLPDFRVHLGDEQGPDIGGGWKRVGERAGNYIALDIDSPLFPAPFRPVLFRADDKGRALRLSWKRPRPRDDRS